MVSSAYSMIPVGEMRDFHNQWFKQSANFMDCAPTSKERIAYF